MNASFIAVLFVDVYDSVGLFERLGDQQAHRLIAECRQCLITVIERYEGRVIKTQGDSILATFGDADAACEAAAEMQTQVCAPQVLLKVGFQFGPVIEEGGDVFGNTVNTAARLVGIARPQEILTTEETVGTLSVANGASARFLAAVRMKGKSVPTRVFVIRADHDSQLTVTTADLAAERAARQPNCLLLVIGREWERVVTGGDRRLVIGRDAVCDIVLREGVVSRRHAMIEAKGGEFFLTDCSTNGTFIQCHDRDVIQLRRQCVALSGAGLIALGRWPTADHPNVIRYARMLEQPPTAIASRA